jgi:hypothetical protein
LRDKKPIIRQYVKASTKNEMIVLSVFLESESCCTGTFLNSGRTIDNYLLFNKLRLIWGVDGELQCREGKDIRTGGVCLVLVHFGIETASGAFIGISLMGWWQLRVLRASAPRYQGGRDFKPRLPQRARSP